VIEAGFLFALDWVHDPPWRGLVVACAVLGGVAVVVTVPLSLGATAVFWRERTRARVSVRESWSSISPWSYLFILLFAIAVGGVYIFATAWRTWLWPPTVVLSLAAFAAWRIRSRRER
jgi:hypothetical protein